MRVVVTRIEQDGTMQRRVVDTARHSDCRQWERLAGRVLEFPPPYRPVPGIPVYHVSLGDRVILVAEHDLGGPGGSKARIRAHRHSLPSAARSTMPPPTLDSNTVSAIRAWPTDPIIALGIAGWSVWEGNRSWHGADCC